jgi:AbrB family looped-hinge helix DNA binding protein
MQTVKVSQGGRVVIPAEVREKLHIEQGDELFVEARDDVLVMTSKAQKIRQIQREIYEQIAPFTQGRSLADELIAERREEAAKEEAELQEWLNAQKNRT